MAKVQYFDRLSSIMDVIKDQQETLCNCSDPKQNAKTIQLANFYNLQQIAVNTALVVDMLDRFVTTMAVDFPDGSDGKGGTDA